MSAVGHSPVRPRFRPPIRHWQSIQEGCRGSWAAYRQGYARSPTLGNKQCSQQPARCSRIPHLGMGCTLNLLICVCRLGQASESLRKRNCQVQPKHLSKAVDIQTEIPCSFDRAAGLAYTAPPTPYLQASSNPLSCKPLTTPALDSAGAADVMPTEGRHGQHPHVQASVLCHVTPCSQQALQLLTCISLAVLLQ